MLPASIHLVLIPTSGIMCKDKMGVQDPVAMVCDAVTGRVVAKTFFFGSPIFLIQLSKTARSTFA